MTESAKKAKADAKTGPAAPAAGAPDAEADAAAAPAGQAGQQTLQGGAYEIIRRRLQTHADDLEQRLERLNAARREVFGGVETKLAATERILTANNCVPRDMIALGERLLFGYNVQLGLRRDMSLADVFAVYAQQGAAFVEQPLDIIDSPGFQRDFSELYRYYKNTTFVKFATLGPHLFMVFRVGRAAEDVKTFKWLLHDDASLQYLDNRSDHEYRFPPQHEFEWTRAGRDMHRAGAFPHISILDKIFVETTGGDVTIKVEDNTATGEGIYTEPVDDPDQTLDDAEIHFAQVGHLLLLRIKPYREERYRHIVYSEKVRSARRVDTIADACVLLPEDHGIIFSNGYYLQTGEYKTFESGLTNMVFDRRLASPNGEDYLYVFYNRDSGAYALLSYNIIEQRVANPIECHGYSLFRDGRLLYFKAQDEPTKSHTVQIWTTPYAAEAAAVAARQDSLLFKIGNRDIVRCMAGCRTLLGLLRREDSYANLYMDMARQANDLLDSYFWIHEADACAPGAPLVEIKAAAGTAMAEFERVVQLRAAAAAALAEADHETRDLLNNLRLARHEHIQAHVDSLASLRALIGRILALRDVRYMDLARVQALEAQVKERQERQARQCVDFLLDANAMTPYHERLAAMEARLPALEKVSQAETLRQEVETVSAELEMLIDIVTNLKIEDATQRTAITDSIAALFTGLNQLRAALQNRRKQLATAEGEAEFASQLKLLGQAVINYLDVCDTPAKCEDYLSRVMIQIEELEGQFADFDDYILKLTDTREGIYNAFETRRLALVEARNKRADTLMSSATRILNSIRSRAATLKTNEAIHGYFASDMMIERLRGIVAQLTELDDPVKADDLQTRLKSLREDAVRQLHDRQELYVGDENVIQFGRHRFSVNPQALDLTLVPRGDAMMLHLTGTNFFEAIDDQAFLATRPAWNQALASESDTVYRAEYLAHLMLADATRPGAATPPAALAALEPAARLAAVRAYMAPRYAEGYQKGVHDEDAAAILAAAAAIHSAIGLLRHGGSARALAIVFWRAFADDPARPAIQARMQGFGDANRAFRQSRRYDLLIDELATRIAAYAAAAAPLFDPSHARAAALYGFEVIAGDGQHPVSAEAAALCARFAKHLRRLAAEPTFAAARDNLGTDHNAAYSLAREWLAGYLETDPGHDLPAGCLDEAAAHLADPAADPTALARRAATTPSTCTLEGMRGIHPRITDGKLPFDYNDFSARLEHHAETVLPRYEHYQELKKTLLENHRKTMRLDEFKPRVMTSFVRNRLIDQVYLPLAGENLAKQIGTVGDTTRTDRSGMLMLISPPGYGKTTLMEYICNRLGLVFMKINGPAVGHLVTSLDPAEAPNAAAREELHKLGLALEMGDNIMLYVDDIQHCNPEFLQKFISLCDAQRKIEGVYKGRTRTYDLRGKKVAVVMAGNPYTESGEKFRLPDMLANRADIYNLGDILGDHVEPFELSFLENALTSNPVLHKLASASRHDVHAVIRIARTGSREGIELEGRYADEELAEMLAVMTKLLRVRDVVLRVNAEYIRSAGQQDDYRTEPAFRLQGSYRNMNRLAAKIEAVMNDSELQTLILSEYENEAQTLTTGAEANLLKLHELLGLLTDAERERWKQIKSTFARHQLMRGSDETNPVGQAVAQLAGLGQGLADIRDLLKEGVATAGRPTPAPPDTLALAPDTLERLETILRQRQAPPPTAAAPAGPIETRLADDTFERLAEIILDTRQTRRLEERHQQLAAKCRKLRDEFLIPLKQQSNNETTDITITVNHLDAVLRELNAILD